MTEPRWVRAEDTTRYERIPAKDVLEADYNQVLQAWMDHVHRCKCTDGARCRVRLALNDVISAIAYGLTYREKK